MDKRFKAKDENLKKQISKTKRETGRKEILSKLNDFKLKQSDRKFTISSNRKLKHISFDEYKQLLQDGKTILEITKLTSKHLVYFYSAIVKGRITLNKEKFEEMYNNGMSLNEIAKSLGINRDHMTHLRVFYGIKRKGATFQKRLKNELPLSDEAKDIIIGSMLGDGHITKWGYFSEKHSPAQLEYLKWKADFLPNITTNKSWVYCENIDERSGTLIKTHSYRTSTHSWIQEIEKMWYENIDGKRTKIIPPKITDWMNERILSILFMDDGNTDWGYRNGYKKYKTKPRCKISTQSFNKEENEMLQSIISDKFGINSNIFTRINKKGKIQYYLMFGQDDSEKLINLIRPFLHKDLLYKGYETEYIKKMNNKRNNKNKDLC